MGKALSRYYAYIRKERGYEGQLELAIETKIPSTKAALVEDSLELIELFIRAITRITGSQPPRFK